MRHAKRQTDETKLIDVLNDKTCRQSAATTGNKEAYTVQRKGQRRQKGEGNEEEEAKGSGRRQERQDKGEEQTSKDRKKKERMSPPRRKR
ncbi:hypothetical protein Tco_0585586 [Tanacetum coccineum]